MNSIVIFTGTPEEEEDFFFNMTGNSRIVPITKEGTSDEAYDESLKLNLYRYMTHDNRPFAHGVT